MTESRFSIGDRVRKIRGSCWQGRVVGYYSTELTPHGVCVESECHANSVQIYPEAALELVDGEGLTMTEWVEWADGISVSKADYEALTGDMRLFGSAIVETIGGLRGRRIAPEKFYMRTAPANSDHGEQSRNPSEK